jgi:hypothetical protein
MGTLRVDDGGKRIMGLPVLKKFGRTLHEGTAVSATSDNEFSEANEGRHYHVVYDNGNEEDLGRKCNMKEKEQQEEQQEEEEEVQEVQPKKKEKKQRKKEKKENKQRKKEKKEKKRREKEKKRERKKRERKGGKKRKCEDAWIRELKKAKKQAPNSEEIGQTGGKNGKKLQPSCMPITSFTCFNLPFSRTNEAHQQNIGTKRPGICALPYSALGKIAAFSTPPRVYMLCLTSAHFHTNIQAQANRFYLATRLLRLSLESSLTRVMAANGHHVALDLFASMHDADGRPGVLISGSIMVQAVLGVEWAKQKRHDESYTDMCLHKPHTEHVNELGEMLYLVYKSWEWPFGKEFHYKSWEDMSQEEQSKWRADARARARKNCAHDLDIFCTPEAAPAVRSMLVNKRYILTGLPNDTYMDNGLDSARALSLSNKVHHVEQYAPWIDPSKSKKEFEAVLEEKGFFQNGDQFKTENLPWTVAGGATAHHSNPTEEHKMRVLPGGKLPYNFKLQCDATIDLVVGESGCKDAQDLLGSFDILLCKASFDGLKFRIPHPHFSFMQQSALESTRQELMQTFVKMADANYSPTLGYGPTRYDEGSLRLPFDASRSSLAHADLRTGTFEQDNDCFEQDGESVFGESYTDMCLHNFFARLFHRYQKYCNRGITFVGNEGSHNAFLQVACRLGIVSVGHAFLTKTTAIKPSCSGTLRGPTGLACTLPFSVLSPSVQQQQNFSCPDTGVLGGLGAGGHCGPLRATGGQRWGLGAWGFQS